MAMVRTPRDSMLHSQREAPSSPGLAAVFAAAEARVGWARASCFDRLLPLKVTLKPWRRHPMSRWSCRRKSAAANAPLGTQ